ncbi:MAG: pilus assembly protein PilP [Desulfovermiculus sp.]
MKGKTLRHTIGIRAGNIFNHLVLAGLLVCGPALGLKAQTHIPSADIGKPDWITPPAFTYTAQDRVDPFASFLHSPENGLPEDQAADSSLSPLEKVAPSQLKLVGILQPHKKQSRSALVELPDGKGYILRPGTPIGRNQGIVTIISPDKVTIEETKTTPWGREILHSVVLELHGSGEEDAE